jgi:N-acetylmuramoyl-L-alanine amidase
MNGMENNFKCSNCGSEYDISINPSNPPVESNYLWILDNGHGGVIDGVYQTPGKRSPVWPDGTQLYEGEFNRSIVDRIIKLCNQNGIETINLVDTQEDVPLEDRTEKANDIYRKRLDQDGKCIYVSIHANGFSDESANGWEVYTSKGETKSDRIATVLWDKARNEFVNENMRKDSYSDGDVDKEANFWVLSKTIMPAILSENFFMTNYDNCHKYLQSEEGRDRIAKIHFQMIQEIEKTKIV